MDLHGFKRVEMSDHDCAAYLKKHGALNRHESVANSKQWRDASGRVVLLITYHGEGGMETRRYIPESEFPVKRGRIDKRRIYMTDGAPRYVRCYDDGKSGDRYTVCFTGNYRRKTAGQFLYVGMSAAPFHPQGIGQHGESNRRIDWPKYGHLGRKIRFSDLPKDCQKLVRRDYAELWHTSA